ncbi:glutathione S-transferase [Amylibacter kogurei]|uniref:Glutathione S-transferase n=1 Tax=Paramylibacter kogurei TaxID=1889778 RepID=A0A2G5K8P5_9RHOB|nr:glutathione S-transferase [Amylibacter kogurei]PIB25901.1 glutathione S-transferase [Amylibacter kogurei]
MAEYQLYCFGESGNAYKAALTLELSGCDWDPIFVDYFNGEARSEAFHQINEMGEVPVMVHGDTTLSQSGVIQDYLIEQTGKFGGTSPKERREIWRWVLFDNHKLSSQAGVTRFLMNFIPEDKRPTEAIAFLQARLQSAYKTLNNHLTGREWMVGDALSVADISCCGYLYYPEEFGFNRADWPEIDAWLDRIAATPGWKHPYDLMKPAYPPQKS